MYKKQCYAIRKEIWSNIVTRYPQGNDSLVENRIPKINYTNKYIVAICESYVEGFSLWSYISGYNMRQSDIFGRVMFESRAE